MFKHRNSNLYVGFDIYVQLGRSVCIWHAIKKENRPIVSVSFPLNNGLVFSASTAGHQPTNSKLDAYHRKEFFLPIYQ